MDESNLRIAAAICSLFGSGILAWRVKGILEALSFVALTHEVNIQQLMQPSGDIFNFTNSNKHVENSKKINLLVLGFILLFVSAFLQLLAAIQVNI